METSGSEFNPWLHSQMGVVDGVPHRWEQTLGVNRMFFDADHDVFLVGGPMYETEQHLESAQVPMLSENWNDPIAECSSIYAPNEMSQHLIVDVPRQARDVQSSLTDLSLRGGARERRVSFAAATQHFQSSIDMGPSFLEAGIEQSQP
jgi:hypothetical protein